GDFLAFFQMEAAAYAQHGVGRQHETALRTLDLVASLDAVRRGVFLLGVVRRVHGGPPDRLLLRFRCGRHLVRVAGGALALPAHELAAAATGGTHLDHGRLGGSRLLGRLGGSRLLGRLGGSRLLGRLGIAEARRLARRRGQRRHVLEQPALGLLIDGGRRLGRRRGTFPGRRILLLWGGFRHQADDAAGALDLAAPIALRYRHRLAATLANDRHADAPPRLT